MISAPLARRRCAPLHQRGVSMLFALMALVIMSLASVALVRSVDTGTLIMGNLGFRQDAMASTSTGTDLALTWLQNNINSSTLNQTIAASGYSASYQPTLDPTGNTSNSSNLMPVIDWDNNGCASFTSGIGCNVPFTVPAQVNGNTVKYFITRVCQAPGVPSASNLCNRPPAASTSTASERGELAAGGRISGTASSPYYRVIVRVEGGRSTLAYTEVLVHF